MMHDAYWFLGSVGWLFIIAACARFIARGVGTVNINIGETK